MIALPANPGIGDAASRQRLRQRFIVEILFVLSEAAHNDCFIEDHRVGTNFLYLQFDISLSMFGRVMEIDESQSSTVCIFYPISLQIISVTDKMVNVGRLTKCGYINQLMEYEMLNVDRLTKDSMLDS